MKKKYVIIAIVAVVVVAAGLFLYRHRGGDIIGVTTYPNQNKIIMNGKADHPMAAGSGFLTVGEEESIHLDYTITGGSFDIYFSANEDAASAYEDMDLENLPTEEDMMSNASIVQEGIEGKDSLDFEAEPGDYTVYFVLHDTVGKAVVTAKGGSR